MKRTIPEAELDQAYKDYLEVFPDYWGWTDRKPESKASFLVEYEFALLVRDMYEKALVTGTLDGATYFMANNIWDQFLGIHKTRDQLDHGFKNGFLDP